MPYANKEIARLRGNERSRLWKLAHPERAAASQKIRDERRRHQHNEQRRERRFRNKSLTFTLRDQVMRQPEMEDFIGAFGIITSDWLTSPLWVVVDVNGKRHTETLNEPLPTW